MNNRNVPTHSNLSDITKTQLISDFKVVVSDAEALIKATANQGGEALASVHAKAQDSLAMAKEKMAAVEEALMVRTKAAVKATDGYVHENPWQSIGVGAGLGLLVGFLISRR